MKPARGLASSVVFRWRDGGLIFVGVYFTKMFVIIYISCLGYGRNGEGLQRAFSCLYQNEGFGFFEKVFDLYVTKSPHKH